MAHYDHLIQLDDLAYEGLQGLQSLLGTVVLHQRAHSQHATSLFGVEYPSPPFSPQSAVSFKTAADSDGALHHHHDQSKRIASIAHSGVSVKAAWVYKCTTRHDDKHSRQVVPDCRHEMLLCPTWWMLSSCAMLWIWILSLSPSQKSMRHHESTWMAALKLS